MTFIERSYYITVRLQACMCVSMAENGSARSINAIPYDRIIRNKQMLI